MTPRFSILLPTHDFEGAEAIVDRVVLLRAGRVAAMTQAGASLRDRYRRAMRDLAAAGGGDA